MRLSLSLRFQARKRATDQLELHPFAWESVSDEQREKKKKRPRWMEGKSRGVWAWGPVIGYVLEGGPTPDLQHPGWGAAKMPLPSGPLRVARDVVSRSMGESTETALPIRREPASIVYAAACKKPKRTRGDNTDTFLSVCLSVNVYRAGIAIQMGNQASCDGCDAFAPSAALAASRRSTNTGSLPALRLLTNFHSWETHSLAGQTIHHATPFSGLSPSPRQTSLLRRPLWSRTVCTPHPEPSPSSLVPVLLFQSLIPRTRKVSPGPPPPLDPSPPT